ncbi:MAG: phosphatidylinositol-specific phospholipase C/glycerophosphodiester phosphodiesterase family protein, partial [Verrucomicrobiia bacterium]
MTIDRLEQALGFFIVKLRHWVRRVVLGFALIAVAAVGGGDACAQAGETKPGPVGKPVPLARAHAHNDYEHARPLLDALDCGFCSFEADVHLVDGELLVAHDRIRTRPDRTLTALYLEPLRRRVLENGGRVYRGGPVCTLLIDIKSEGEPTYEVLHRQLTRFSDVLTTFADGKIATNALIVLISGNCPRETITVQPLRYAACDGRKADLDSDVPVTLVPLVSERWGGLFKWRGTGPMPESEHALLRALVDKAHARGRRIRFWGTPDTPEFWRVIYDARVDL